MKLTATNPAGLHLILAIVLAIVLAGCGDTERVVEITRQADERQAEQNRQIARVVNEETVFRQDAAKLQRDLRADQAAIAQQRDQLEAERRDIAGWRQWAIFFTPLLESLGVVAVVVAVLSYCGFLVHTLREQSPADAVLADSIVQQILSVSVESLPPPTQLPSDIDSQFPIPRITDARRKRA